MHVVVCMWLHAYAIHVAACMWLREGMRGAAERLERLLTHDEPASRVIGHVERELNESCALNKQWAKVSHERGVRGASVLQHRTLASPATSRHGHHHRSAAIWSITVTSTTGALTAGLQQDAGLRYWTPHCSLVGCRATLEQLLPSGARKEYLRPFNVS